MLGLSVMKQNTHPYKESANNRFFFKRAQILQATTITSKNLQKLYNLGDRATKIAHTCLRLGCSNLSSHLKKNVSVREYESCLYGFPNEDPDHFFISCPLYADIRHDLLEFLHFIQSQITINANLLLHRSRNLKYDQNKVIFNAAHKFIAQSKWF